MHNASCMQAVHTYKNPILVFSPPPVRGVVVIEHQGGRERKMLLCTYDPCNHEDPLNITKHHPL